MELIQTDARRLGVVEDEDVRRAQSAGRWCRRHEQSCPRVDLWPPFVLASYLIPYVSSPLQRVSMASGCQELWPVFLTVGVTALLVNLDLG